MEKTERFHLHNDYDVVVVRQRARELAHALGLSLMDQTRVATAVSEVARRAVECGGVMLFQTLQVGARCGLECTCLLDKPLDEGSNSPPTRGRPAGLFGEVGRLLDDFQIQPRPDGKVTVVMRKWMR